MSRIRNTRFLTILGALLAILMGGQALIGWQFDIHFLRTSPLTAVHCMLLGLSLLVLLNSAARSLYRRIAFATVVFVGVTALTRLSDLWGTRLELDRFGDNRMAPNTALCLVLLSGSLLAFDRRAPRGLRPSDVFALVTFAVSLLALVGHFYGVQLLYGVSSHAPMSVATAVVLSLFAVGVLAAHPQEGVAAVYAKNDVGGMLVRRLLPVVVIVPILFGGLVLIGHGAGWFEYEFGASLLAVSTVLVLGTVTWKAGSSLSATDEALQKQTQINHSILQSIGDGIMVLDTKDDLVAYNPACERMLEMSMYHSDRAAWRARYKICLADGVTPLRAEMRPLYRALRGEEVEPVDLCFERADGGYKATLNTVTQAIRDEDGDIWGGVSVFRDVTQDRLNAKLLREANEDLERKVSERLAQLSKAEAQIQQLQKLDAVGRLAGGIAHDFNNILGAMQMYCDFMLEKSSEPEVIIESIKELEKATARGAGLTRQLLVFSRNQVVNKKAVDLNALLKEHLKMLTRLIGPQISVDLRLSDSLPQIEADPGQIEQVIMNLVINARDAMPSGGRIIVETTDETLNEASAVTHLAAPAGRYSVLSVTDNGCGMDEKIKAQIFEPFFTTKAVGSGTGLGLSTVYGIVKSFGGSIWLYSEPRKGSVFKIYFPAIASHSEPSVDVEESAARGGEETVLLVEDEENLRNLYAGALRNQGYNVLTAEHGKRALEILKARQGDIALLLTDMMMPEMGGAELVRSVQPSLPELRVICMSGYPGDGLDDLSRQQMKVEFLQKPFNTNTLVTKVRALLDV